MLLIFDVQQVGPCPPEGQVSTEALPLGGRSSGPLGVYVGLPFSTLKVQRTTPKASRCQMTCIEGHCDC